MLDDRIARLLQDRKPGHSLPRDFYVDEEIFRADMKAVFETDWLFACNLAEVPRASACRSATIPLSCCATATARWRHSRGGRKGQAKRDNGAGEKAFQSHASLHCWFYGFSAAG